MTNQSFPESAKDQNSTERFQEWFFYGEDCPFNRENFPGQIAPPELLEESYKLQYRTFVEKEGWILPEADHQGRRDIDHFNRYAWKGLITDSMGRLVACYRLMPADGINMLYSEFPALTKAIDPKILHPYFNHTTAEISRVALCPKYLAEPGLPELINQRTRQLFSITSFCFLRSARILGKTNLLGVVEDSLDRYLASPRNVGLAMTHLNSASVVVGSANETERIQRRNKRRNSLTKANADNPLREVRAFLNVLPTDLNQHPHLRRYIFGLSVLPPLNAHSSKLWDLAGAANRPEVAA